MTANSTRLPCFLPRTPSLPRDGAPRLLQRLDSTSALLFEAIEGRYGAGLEPLIPEKAAAHGFTHLPLPGGHSLLFHTSQTVLLFVYTCHVSYWFPVALHAPLVHPKDIRAHAPRLAKEALSWLRQDHHRLLGWGATHLLPVHANTPDPSKTFPTASLGGQTALRAPVEPFHAFFGLATSFLERHPALVWDDFYYTTGLVEPSGCWTREPKLKIFFPQRQGGTTAQKATQQWDAWSTAFLREVLKKRTLPAGHLAGWYWNVQHPDGAAHRCPYTLTLALDHGNSPFAQGASFDLRSSLSAHQRLAFQSAFQRAAPATYARWHAGQHP